MPSPAHEFSIAVLFPSVRRPFMIGTIAPHVGAVAVTITSAFFELRRVVTACQEAELPPPAGADW